MVSGLLGSRNDFRFYLFNSKPQTCIHGTIWYLQSFENTLMSRILQCAVCTENKMERRREKSLIRYRHSHITQYGNNVSHNARKYIQFIACSGSLKT